MKLKKITALLLSVMICIAALAVNASAATTKKGISLSKSSVTVNEGSTYTLKATVTGYKSYTITWSTSNKSVATIAKGGIITGKKAGTAKITATIKGTSYSASCNVTVKGTSKTTAASQTVYLPDPAAYFGCSGTANIGTEKYEDGYCSSVMLDMNKNGMCIPAYMALIKSKYNFSIGDGIELEDTEKSRLTMIAPLTYNGKENVAGMELIREWGPTPATLTLTYDFPNSRVLLSIYHSKDVKFADNGDRGDWQSMIPKNSSGSSSGSTSSGSSSSSSSRSSSGSSGSSSSGSSRSSSGSSGSSSSGSSGSSSSSSSRRTSRVTVKCTKCHGSGTVSCTNCGGRGYKEKTKSTPNYSGKKGGAKSYTTRENCFKCRGTGSTTCTRCGGSGNQ
ncbi:MAG: Ig-like domain-containing protein [Oscillospiraceae bacterium]|nr:Ig-like domain-containing protein [Oscillospiraceae bacterium]